MSDIDTDYEITEILEASRRDGSMIRGKAKVLAEDLLARLYPRIQDPETPTLTLLEIGKQLIVLGDLAPKQGGLPGGQGGGFSITINIPASDGREGITITGTAQPSGDPAPMLDITDFGASLPEKPQWIPIPDFNLNADLSGGLPPSFDARAAVPMPPAPPRVGQGATPVSPSTHSLAPMGAFAKAVMAPPSNHP